jgi:hypothetical protein
MRTRVPVGIALALLLGSAAAADAAPVITTFASYSPNGVRDP